MSKIVIAAGSSGGHLYPAQALANDFIEKGDTVHFMAGGLKSSPFFNAKQYSYYDIPCGTWKSKSPWQLLKSGLQLFSGIIKSRKWLKELSPDLVVGFGGVASFPVLIAAKWLGLPVILHEQNAIPGKVNRWLSPYVAWTGTHFRETLPLLKGKSLHVGMPLRQELRMKPEKQEEAWEYFGLEKGRDTLLVFGGSQGALAVNHLTFEALTTHPHRWQVIHLTGQEKMTDPIREGYRKKGILAYVASYEERMDLAWSIANFSITRAGGSSLAEQLEFEVPGILIPYPYAENHQQYNAEAFNRMTEAVIILKQAETTSDQLFTTLSRYGEKEKRSALKNGLRDARKRIPQETLKLKIEEWIYERNAT